MVPFGAANRRLRPARAALLAAGLLACAGGAPDAPPADGTPDAPALAEALAARPRPSEGTLVVRLAFGAGADLDLYVTGPLLETVYFGRVETRSGGRLLADRRCGGAPLRSGSVRIEEVRFERPPPGRYRVGVDHPQRCDGGDAAAAFALLAAGPGVERAAQGTLPVERFAPAVLELEVAPPRRGRRPARSP